MKGKLIVIDGIDGSGKGTQFELLLEKMDQLDIPVQTKDFPQYGKKSAGAVEEYLNGKYGDAKEVGPYRASVLFAVDRYDASHEMKKWLADGSHVICNRYVTANMGHQGGKIRDKEERMRYFEWLKELEFGIFDIPKPDLNIFLHVPPETAIELIEQKGFREYIGGEGKDLHEGDLQHLKETEEVFLQLADIMPNAHIIYCAPEGKLLSREEIHEKIWEVVRREINV